MYAGEAAHKPQTTFSEAPSKRKRMHGKIGEQRTTASTSPFSTNEQRPTFNRDLRASSTLINKIKPDAVSYQVQDDMVNPDGKPEPNMQHQARHHLRLPGLAEENCIGYLREIMLSSYETES